VKYSLFNLCFGLFICSLLMISCERNQTVCTPQNDSNTTPIKLDDLIVMTPVSKSSTTPVVVEIQGKMLEVDKLVDYPVCNDTWSGIVYVGCDAKVAEAKIDADENPLFFKGCDLNIQPNSVVYVAAHNDQAFYKGCSCHTGEDPTH